MNDTQLCADHDEDCPSIFAEGYCLHCWLHDPARGFCPYLRNVDIEEEQVALQESGSP